MTAKLALTRVFPLGIGLALLAVLGAALSPSAAKSTWITADEAKLPAYQGPAHLKMRGIPSGPRIVVLAPPASGGAFVSSRPVKLHVRFEAVEGAAVDVRSLKVTYLRLFGIDITDRVKPYVTARGIDIDDVDIPPGEHSIELEIRDIRGNLSDQVLKLVVR
jgi:hypothetical protein